MRGSCKWKSALGWVCVAAIAWRYIGVSFIETAFHLFGDELVILRSDSTQIFALVATLLGVGGLHSYDNRHAQWDGKTERRAKKEAKEKEN